MTRPEAWLVACRPKTLPVGALPVAVGTAVAAAAGGWRPGPAAAALGGALLLQIGCNLVNDAADFARGADGPDRIGPARAVQSGLLSLRAVRAGAALAFFAALGCGLYLSAVAGWPVVAIGLASIVAAVAYTAGPWPLGYHGLGDACVFAFFGLAGVAGTAYVQRGQVPALAWWAAVPVGALATAVLVVNNLRDRAGDARAGKRTLVVRWGRTAGVVEYVALLAVAYAIPIALCASGRASAWALAPLATAPPAVGLARRVAAAEGAALAPYLGGTVRLLVAYGVLWTAVLAWS